MTKLEELMQAASDTPKSSPTDAIIIAGPCSAETEEQVMETAKRLQPAGINYFRAGIWKPRTSPDSFEGVGAAGLPWLQRVKRELGMRSAIEVANARHVELALDHGVDLLWIGARTSVNPFAVQDIADALKGVQVPVMVKNPINPDLKLWKGALERILRADVKEVIACHRGFAVYGQTRLRNAPLWEIPIDLKREFPELPMVCDPSHIAGRRDLIEEISRKALDLGYEGLIIETHRDPDAAWSDAAQQLTPEVLIDLLGRLEFRDKEAHDAAFLQDLQALRTELDEVDSRMQSLIAQRMELSRSIGNIKKANNVAFYQQNRWNEVLKQVQENAERLNLNEEFMLKLFSLLHLESLDIQGE